MVVCRGIPGSGKSTKAKEIAGDLQAVIHSTDEYFLDKNGEYKFNGSKIKEAHKWNRDRTLDALTKEQNVIIDNTNIKNWEFEPYLKMAEDLGYEVYQLVCSGSYQNTHGVPQEVVERMGKTFEESTLPHWSNDVLFQI